MNRKRVAPLGRFLAPILLGLILAAHPAEGQGVPADAQYVASSRAESTTPSLAVHGEASDQTSCSSAPRARRQRQVTHLRRIVGVRDCLGSRFLWTS